MQNVIKKLFYGAVFSTMLICKTLAVPATPELVTITQPDGSKIEVYIRGDENINWFESTDQFTLLRNEAGFIVYATKNANGDLIPSQHIFTNDGSNDNATKERTDFITNLDKKLFFSERQVSHFINDAEKPNINQKNQDNFQNYYIENSVNIEGTRKYLVVLMSYPDLPFTKTKEDFEALFNEVGYGNYGSVRDYFVQNSYGKFTPEFIIVGPYTTEFGIDYYKANSRPLAEEAVWHAYMELNNMVQFDNDNDGLIDAVNIIFSGWGEEAGFQQGIWSHASHLVDNTGSPYYLVDGKYIRRYCCAPELRGNGGDNISNIGVLAHEFTHTLGALDFYDTDGATGGNFTGAGNWCIMANGSWLSGGACPANINIFQKWMFGWVDPINLATQDVSVVDMPNSAFHSVAYRIDTDTKDELYIMENRQRTGFDRFVPGSGLLIWRVHTLLPAYLFYGANAINAAHPQLMYPVCASSTFAQPSNTPSSYGVINSAGTPFPGSSNNTEFTDNSIPSARSWTGKPINRPITNITETDSLISFNYVGRPDFILSIPYSYNVIEAKHFTDLYTSVSVDNSTNTTWRRIQESGNWVIELRSFLSADKTPKEYYLFLPPFYLLPNYIYSFDVNYKVFSGLYPGNMKLYLCNTKNINDKILIEDFGDALDRTNFTTLSATFNVPNDAVYYLAICSHTKGDYMQLLINNISITGLVGVEEEHESKITIFPNPAKNNIHIVNHSNETIENIEIFDLDGKNILTTKNPEIDITNLTSGTYIVKIKTNKKTYLEKIVK
ncbi:MAG: M6 family metalloprotease domain-containing protein [Bacteroidetes bacterium]|nr:M6 family metalloprotease domain-containing protein [Bacteroidota bacterium]